MSDVTWFADKKNKLRRSVSRLQHFTHCDKRVIVALTSYPPELIQFTKRLDLFLDSRDCPIKSFFI